MWYEIWDVATGNCIGRYASEGEALSRISRLVGRFGSHFASDLELSAEDDVGNFRGTWTGAALISRAEAALAPREATTS